MNIQKKNHLKIKRISSFVKKLTMLLYIAIVVLSIFHHEFTNIYDVISELIVYTILGLMLYVVIDSIDINEFKDFFKND